MINKAYYLPRIGAGEEIRNQYQQLSQALEEFVGKTFQEWALSIDKVMWTFFFFFMWTLSAIVLPSFVQVREN